MKGSDLVALLDRAMEPFAASRDELRDLDAALGDGDLGITVSKSCAAVRAVLAELADPSPAQVLRSRFPISPSTPTSPLFASLCWTESSSASPLTMRPRRPTRS